jgi:hypothetical protein
MTDWPDFHELVGDDLPEEEQARLQRVHELLIKAGPPPELPQSLTDPPSAGSKPAVSYLPRRRLGAALLLAAAIAAAAFGGGYLLGNHTASFGVERAIPMHSTEGSLAQASLQLGHADTAGNRAIQMVVRGLPDLGRKGYYELYLTRAGKRAASCGTFVVHGQATIVRLNAPYLISPSSKPGWIVVAHLRRKPDDVLLTT